MPRKHNLHLKMRMKYAGKRLVHGYETKARKKHKTKKRK